MRTRVLWAGVAAIVAASAIGAAALVPAPMPSADVQARIDAWRLRWGYPAVSVAIAANGATATHVSAADGSSIAPDTQFRVASITKLFVATVVLQLAEEGGLDLDAPAGRFAPDLPAGGDVTVRQLLSHTSGLPDYGTEELTALLVGRRDRRWTAAEVLARVSDRRDFPPGADWQYSNTNYLVLGEVVAAVTGRSWHAELRDRILRPLGLDDTFVAGFESPQGAGLVAEALFDLDNDGDVEDVEDGSWPALETSEGPAGAIVSTATDVTAFTAALFAGRVVSRDSLAAMVTGSGFGRRFDDYGLGVEIRRPDLATLVWGHGGFLPGYRSVTWFVPSRETTITVLVNDSRADAADLADVLLSALP